MPSLPPLFLFILFLLSDSGEPVYDGDCLECQSGHDYDSILLCDRCDGKYHMGCLNPPLTEIPDQNWFCPNCVAGYSGAHAYPETFDPYTHEHRRNLGGAGIKEAVLQSAGWQGYDGACGCESGTAISRLESEISATLPSWRKRENANVTLGFLLENANVTLGFLLNS